MIRSCRARIADDRGNTGIAVIVASPFLLAFMLVLVSAQQYFDATRQAQSISAEAARIAAQPDSDIVRESDFSGVEIDSAKESVVRDFVERHEGASLTKLDGGVADPTVVAEIEIDVEYIFDVPGLPDKAIVDSSAQVLRGVEGDGL